MKVVYIHRQGRPGGHSIEELFRTIADEMRQHAEVVEYECGSRWSVLMDAWRLRHMGADIYHITGDIHYLALLLPGKNTVLTVHDLYHYTHQLQGIKRWLFKWLWLVLPIQAAGAVTAISRETEKNIRETLAIRDRAVTVIGNCVSPLFRPIEKTFDPDRPGILQIGTRPNKNLPRVIEAIRGMSCHLSIIGPLSQALSDSLHEAGIDYENHIDLSLEQVAEKYAEADIVCFASLYEGFGMPIIEAQAARRPVITSNRSPMKEVAGDAACLADPESPDQIRQCIQKISHDENYRAHLVTLGLDNARRYAAATVAGQYYDLYKNMLAP